MCVTACMCEGERACMCTYVRHIYFLVRRGGARIVVLLFVPCRRCVVGVSTTMVYQYQSIFKCTVCKAHTRANCPMQHCQND